MPPERLSLQQSVAILLLAVFFSGAALHHAERWHPDEAFYMTFARNAAVKGDWLLLSEPVDKPPLTFYTNALALTFFAVDADENGVLFLDVHKGEFAGRLPSLWMSILLVAAVMALAKSIYRKNSVALLAGLLVALSPLRIVFAATAFTDMPMLLLATLSLWMAARKRPMWAGVWFVLSIAAKPQSMFYLPVLMICIVGAQRAAPLRRARYIVPLRRNWFIGAIPHGCLPSVIQIARFLLPILAGGLILLAWDFAREARGAVNIWAMGRANYTPTTLTPLADLPARFAIWWQTVQHTYGIGIISAPLLLLGIVYPLLRWRPSNAWSKLLALWIMAFFGLHMAFTLNLYDRNLLVLLPPAALLTAKALCFSFLVSFRNVNLTPKSPLHLERGLSEPVLKGFSPPLRPVREPGGEVRNASINAAPEGNDPTDRHYNGFAFTGGVILFGLILAVFAWQAAMGSYKIGGDRGAHNGIDVLAEYLNSKPVATVIYDRWLDWELDYYLGEWTNKRRVYYPTPEELAAGALELDEIGTRYFVAPDTVEVLPWLDALREAGFTVREDTIISSFLVYSVQPPR